MNNGLPGPNPTETITGGKTLELSKYDKIRKPHKAIIDDTKIKVTARTLSTELCCPICLDLLTCTMTTKECLHRFCSECITTALMRGNKECPTCRKKIVSKRSLRPDPNFDFLINKIWPDRRQYDAELSASMQMFREQSNVAALQKSIEEGIKAQAAYRKQRIQGSYDYMKRKRRPKTAVGTEEGTSIEQITVSLAPAQLNGIDGAGNSIDQQQHLQQMEESPVASDNSNESDSGSDSSTEESSSLSSGSSLSSSSAISSHSNSTPNVRPSPQRLSSVSRAVSEEQQRQLMPSTSPSMNEMLLRADSQIVGFEQMVEEMRRRGDEVEVELAPSKAMLQRIGNSNSTMALPIQLGASHYIKTSVETTVAAIAEFLFELTSKPPENPKAPANLSATSVQSGEKKKHLQQIPTVSSILSPLAAPVRPEHFYIVDRSHKLRKLENSDCLAFVFLHSIHWDQHLLIFFDVESIENEKADQLAAVVGDEVAKCIDKRMEKEIGEEQHQLKTKEELAATGSETSTSRRMNSNNGQKISKIEMD